VTRQRARLTHYSARLPFSAPPPRAHSTRSAMMASRTLQRFRFKVWLFSVRDLLHICWNKAYSVTYTCQDPNCQAERVRGCCGSGRCKQRTRPDVRRHLPAVDPVGGLSVQRVAHPDVGYVDRTRRAGACEG
jgi:hypothetical protein